MHKFLTCLFIVQLLLLGNLKTYSHENKTVNKVFGSSRFIRKYQGDWIFSNDSITFILKLHIYKKSIFNESTNTYFNDMTGWYSYKKIINDTIYNEETLSYFNPSINPFIVFEKKLKNEDTSNYFYPSMILTKGSNPKKEIVFSFRRNSPDKISSMCMNIILSYVSKKSIKMKIFYYDNYNFNHQDDYKYAYWAQRKIPSEMVLQKMSKKGKVKN